MFELWIQRYQKGKVLCVRKKPASFTVNGTILLGFALAVRRFMKSAIHVTGADYPLDSTIDNFTDLFADCINSVHAVSKPEFCMIKTKHLQTLL